ncbi:MAG: hypothetical protein AB1505_00280 [Candidatus Latescibacterota bacterium]
MCCSGRQSTGVRAGQCGCGCAGAAEFVRRFLSDDEVADHLEAYRQELLAEASAVEKRVAALRAKA